MRSSGDVGYIPNGVYAGNLGSWDMLTCAAQASAASTTVEMPAMSTCGSPWNVPNTCTLVSILATQPAPQLPMHRNGCPRRFPSLLLRRAMCWPASPSWIQQQRVPLANGVCPPPALHAIRAIHQTQPCNQIVRTGYLRCPNVRCLVVHCGHEYVSVASRGKLRCAHCMHVCMQNWLHAKHQHCALHWDYLKHAGTVQCRSVYCGGSCQLQLQRKWHATCETNGTCTSPTGTADPCTATVVAISSHSTNGEQNRLHRCYADCDLRRWLQRRWQCNV